MRYKHMLKAIAILAVTLSFITLAHGQTQPPRDPKPMQQVQVLKKDNTQIKSLLGSLKGQVTYEDQWGDPLRPPPDNPESQDFRIKVKGHPAVHVNHDSTYVIGDLRPGTYTVLVVSHCPNTAFGDCFMGLRKIPTVTIHAGETSTLNLKAIYYYWNGGTTWKRPKPQP